ncbi:MAG: CAP domain-containing protein [Candidatus Eremiobacteraeota bacterium]|nr:CAP domain-containing protein [Candidatus Eremiobacteraeota bacterium]
MALHPFGLVLFGILSPQGPPLGTLPIPPPPTPVAQPGANVDERGASAMFDAVNRERVASGRAPLVLDRRLAALARDHALDMATRNYFSHETPDGRSPFARMAQADYRFDYAGENMALDEDAQAADHALWNSPEHRDNTLESHFARIGIAAVRTNDGELFVEDFSD